MLLEKNINQNLLNIISELKNQTRTITGTLEGVLSDEMSETLEMTKKIASHGYEQGKNILKFFASSLALQKLQFKKSLIGDKTGKKGILGWLFDLLAPIGLALTPLLHPFRTLGKLFKADWGIGKGFKMSTVLAPVKNLFLAMKKFPLLGGAAKLLGKGFTKLFWPIQSILSTIEFIKGYTSTEGDIKDKIKVGMESVIRELIEFPNKVIGKAIDWTGKKLGFKMEGDEGKAITDAMMKSFDHWWQVVTMDFDGITKTMDKAAGVFGFSTDFNEKYNSMKESMNKWWGSIKTNLGSLKDKFTEGAGNWGQKMKEILNPKGKEGIWIDVPVALDNLKTSYMDFKTGLGESFESWKTSISNVWKEISDFDLKDFMSKKLENFKNVLLGLPEKIGSWIEGILPDWVKTMFGIGKKIPTQNEVRDIGNKLTESDTHNKQIVRGKILTEKQVSLAEERNKLAKEQVELQKKLLEKQQLPNIAVAPGGASSPTVQQQTTADQRIYNGWQTVYQYRQ